MRQAEWDWYDVTVRSQGDQLDVWLCEVSDGLYRKSTPEGIFNRGSTGGIYLLALPFLLFSIRQCAAINTPGWPGLWWSLGKLNPMLVFHLRCSGKNQTSGVCLRQWVHCGLLLQWQLWWRKWPGVWYTSEDERLWEGANTMINEIVKPCFLLGSFSAHKNM